MTSDAAAWGLTLSEVKGRVPDHGPDLLRGGPRRTARSLCVSQVTDFMSVLPQGVIAREPALSARANARRPRIVNGDDAAVMPGPTCA